MDFKVYKCNKCGAVVLAFDDEQVLNCCGDEMLEQVPNSVDASFEKHLPTYIKDGDKLPPIRELSKFLNVNNVTSISSFLYYIYVNSIP